MGKWGVKLDGYVIAKIGNGETQSIQIDERSHNLEVVMLSAFGTPTMGIDPAMALIMAGTDNCDAILSFGVGLVKNKIKIECTYDAPVLSEDGFIAAVSAFLVNVFSGDAILERLNDPNNRRNDLEVHCGKDGVHIQWQVNETTMGKNWSTGYDEEIIPYEAAGVAMSKENLTENLLKRLEASVKNGILAQTRFVKKQYGCFVLDNQKSRLY